MPVKARRLGLGLAVVRDLRDARHRVAAQNQDAMVSTARTEGVTNAAAPDLDVGVLFDRLLDAVIVARLSTGRIELWNPAAEKLFGFSAHEAIGQSIEIIMPAAIADVHRMGYERYLRTGHGLIIDAGAPAINRLPKMHFCVLLKSLPESRGANQIMNLTAHLLWQRFFRA